MKTLVIIPAYNEEASIVSTVEDLRANCPGLDLVVVNDGSTDGTAALCRQRGYPMLDLPVNLGIGGCVQTGYRYARDRGYEAAVQFDADGQHMARHIPDLLSPLERGEADLVIGSRFLDATGFRSGAVRRLGIGFLSALVRGLCGVEVRDVTSGMRAADRAAIDFFAREYAQDYPEPESVLAAGLEGLRIREIAVEMRPRQGGESSITALRGVYYMIKVSLAMVLGRLFRRRRGNAE